jgi:drug/metabolite transporter (DMT)-like permease
MMNFFVAMLTNACMRQACFGFKCEHVGPLITRSFTGLLTFGGLIFGCKLMPLFLANIMMNTGPFWAALLAFLVLGESVRVIDIICMVGCFIGVVVLATAPAPK